jgi:regulatory protein
MAPRITALVAEPRGRVRVELDGLPWRVLPAAAVVGARLAVGIEVDRPRARTLRRELRRVEALAIATGALARRDHSTAGLDARLERLGVAPHERVRALGALERAGYVDDARFAAARSSTLALRGYGDEAIRLDLEQHGLRDDLISPALEGLEPELGRAQALATRRGASARTARWLAGKGFSSDSIAAAIGEPDAFADKR